MNYPLEWYYPMQRLKIAHRSDCQEVPDDDPHDCRYERDADQYLTTPRRIQPEGIL